MLVILALFFLQIGSMIIFAPQIITLLAMRLTTRRVQTICCQIIITKVIETMIKVFISILSIIISA